MALGLKLITPATGKLFTSAEARERARLASSMSDAAIDDLVVEATRFVESDLSRQLLSAIWRQTQDGFSNDSGRCVLFRNPVIEVDSIEYLDGDGDWDEVDNWELDADNEPAIVFPAVADGEWPEVYDRGSNVAITFEAGYGADPADVPPDLRRAVIMMVSHFHEHPEAVALGADARTFEVPLGVAEILDHYRYGRRF